MGLCGNRLCSSASLLSWMEYMMVDLLKFTLPITDHCLMAGNVQNIENSRKATPMPRAGALLQHKSRLLIVCRFGDIHGQSAGLCKSRVIVALLKQRGGFCRWGGPRRVSPSEQHCLVVSINNKVLEQMTKF